MDKEAFLDSDEKIIAVIHKHWINLFPILFAWGVVGLVLLAGFFSLGVFRDEISAVGPLSSAVLALGALTFLWFVLVYLSYWVYRENRLILTNKNFTQVTRNGILQSDVIEFPLEKVQDVTARQNGPIALMLGYGDLIIETAGELPNLTFRQVSQPRVMADRILDLYEKAAGVKPIKNP